MDKIKRNRLLLDPSEEGGERPPVYSEEDYHKPIPTKVRGSQKLLGFFFWAGISLLLALAIGFGVWWQFYRDRPSDLAGGNAGEILSDKRSLDQILERPYLPSAHASEALNKCIQLYRENYVQRAFITCEEFLNSPASDEEKSVALTVLGVLFDNAGRYPLAVERLEKATQYDPKNFHAYYNLSLVFRHMGRMEDARKAAKKAMEIAPNDPKVALLSGNLFSELGDSESAFRAYQTGISASPEDPTLLYNLALAEFKQGKIPSAIENFQKAIQNDPSGRVTVLSHGHLGKIHYDRENYTAAEFHFREAARLQPDSAQNLYNLGLVFLKLNKKEEAVSFFRKAVDAGSNETEVFIRLSEALDSLSLPSLAIQALRKALVIRPSDVDALFAIGDLYYKQGELISAEESFRKIIRLTPGDSYSESAWINLGIVLDEMERYSEAVEALGRAVELNPKNFNAHYNLGIAYLHLGQPARAVASWQRADILESGKSFRAKEQIADYYAKIGETEQAITLYDGVVNENPSAHRTRVKLAKLYKKIKQEKSAEKHLLYVLNHSENASEMKEAHKALALLYTDSSDPELNRKASEEAYRAAHIDPKDMESRLVLAKILSNSDSLSDREKAIDELKIVVASNSTPKTLAQAYNLMGVCQYKNKDFRKSLQSFDNALNMDPSYTEAYDNKRAARAAYEDSIGSRGGL